MFRIGHYTGAVYDAEKISLKDIHECCSLIQMELTDMEVSVAEIAANLHGRCANCLGCEESRKSIK